MKKTAWIESGYKCFALNGPESLKIERLAKDVQKNKSSFYHLFGDLDLFIEELLRFHKTQSKIMTEKESAIKTQEELIAVFIEHKVDLLFNRQLRIHHHDERFQKCFNEIDAESLPVFLPIWKKLIQLEENSYLANLVLSFSLENFYLQISAERINKVWLKEFIDRIKSMIHQFKQVSFNQLIDANN